MLGQPSKRVISNPPPVKLRPSFRFRPTTERQVWSAQELIASLPGVKSVAVGAAGD